MEPTFTLRPLPDYEPPARLYADPRALLLDLALAEYTAVEAHRLDDAADLMRAQTVVRRMAHLPDAGDA
ncbi:hypothetical protein [Amycolatopsis sp. NPDC051903]|uniref:hypothetical protein n=1 Tax=Amycolatopsis sp. NPDC051903 TaxID=3363936 RepID=UPI00379DFBC5